jgi:putative aminopeptidase FrvX
VKQGEQKCGKGPVLTYAPAVHNNVLEMLIQTAENNSIPFQRAASSRFTGTDTDAFAYSNEGVASALISLPLKYMHTTVEMVQYQDVENIIRLMYEFLLQLQDGHDFSYFK